MIEVRNAVVKAVFTLNYDVGIPPHLCDIGVRKKDILMLAQAVFDDVCTGVNLREASLILSNCTISPSDVARWRYEHHYRSSHSYCKFLSICKSVCRCAISQQRNTISIMRLKLFTPLFRYLVQMGVNALQILKSTTASCFWDRYRRH